ncbi:hypothetical protein CRG98_035472 [Punica granatum]|uniref:Retrotransposon gag domain-containing protein n=1 Tax=Punica granatum TaxID=22663 RepID=A0A2I0IJD9_PUNGR|nr:hypothetical protein CRG98_035472 [Punica granatum]
MVQASARQSKFARSSQYANTDVKITAFEVELFERFKKWIVEHEWANIGSHPASDKWKQAPGSLCNLSRYEGRRTRRFDARLRRRKLQPGRGCREECWPHTIETLAEVLERAQGHCEAEEASLIKRTMEAQKLPKRKEKHEMEGAGKMIEDRKRKRTHPGKFETYTPLNASRQHILKEISSQEDLDKPPPMRTSPEKRDSKMYCHFHRDYDHSTEECYQLRDEIESLIRRGMLARYIKKDAVGSSE